MNKRQREAIFMECGKNGHVMTDAPASTPTTVTFGYVLRCERDCGALRHLHINPNTGEVTGSFYEKTDAYKQYIAWKAGRTRAELRLEDLKTRRRRLRAVS